MEGIVKVLERIGIGASPITDKEAIRINLPPLAEDYRKELARLVSQKQEESKQIIRKWREEAWNEIQNNFREGKIREDDKFKGKEKLQEVVDDYVKKIEDEGEKEKRGDRIEKICS